jgi:hypothetical protein
MELEFLLKFSRGGDAIYKTRILLPNIIAHHLQQSLFTHGHTRRKMERERGRERGEGGWYHQEGNCAIVYSGLELLLVGILLADLVGVYRPCHGPTLCFKDTSHSLMVRIHQN